MLFVNNYLLQYGVHGLLDSSRYLQSVWAYQWSVLRVYNIVCCAHHTPPLWQLPHPLTSSRITLLHGRIWALLHPSLSDITATSCGSADNSKLTPHSSIHANHSYWQKFKQNLNDTWNKIYVSMISQIWASYAYKWHTQCCFMTWTVKVPL